MFRSVFACTMAKINHFSIAELEGIFVQVLMTLPLPDFYSRTSNKTGNNRIRCVMIQAVLADDESACETGVMTGVTAGVSGRSKSQGERRNCFAEQCSPGWNTKPRTHLDVLPASLG